MPASGEFNIGQVTNRNAKLFQMMGGDSSQGVDSPKVNLAAYTKNLKTYQTKQKRRDPNNRVNIPYYRKIAMRYGARNQS